MASLGGIPGNAVGAKAAGARGAVAEGGQGSVEPETDLRRAGVGSLLLREGPEPRDPHPFPV